MDLLINIIFFMSIILSVLNPLVGVYTFLIISYVRPQDTNLFLAGIEPAKIILIVTLVSFLFHMIFRKNELTKSAQNWALSGILLCILISGINAIDRISWISATEDFSRIFIVYFLFINLVNTPKKLRNFFIFFLLVNFYVALRFFIAYRTGNAIYWGDKPGDATYGFLANADDLGIGLVIALSFALIPIFYAKNIILKGLCALMSIVFMLGVLATRSRGSALGVFAVFVAVILSQMRWKKIKIRKYAVGLTIVLILFSGFIFKYRWTLQDSFTSAGNASDPGRLGRTSTWMVAKEMIKDMPLTGVGRGNFVPYWRTHYPAGIFGYQVAHNIIYEVAAETGLFGLVFFLSFSLYGLIEIRKLMGRNKQTQIKNDFIEMIFTIYLISLIGFYVNGMTITVAFYWHIYILVAMFVSAKTIFRKELAYETNQA